MYSVEIKGIDFIREEPSEKYEKKMQKIADRYWENQPLTADPYRSWILNLFS